jgi:uncharacterized membrane protein YbhN (UPF0104 family)
MRRLLSFLFKAAISVLLLYVSLRRVDLGGVAQRLGALDLRWIAFVVVTLCVQIALNALRWREVVAVCGASLTVPTALRYTFIDRVVGVAVLALLVAVCLPWTLQLVHDPLAQAGLIVIGIGALFAAAVFLALGTPNLWLMERWWITRHLATASRLAWKLCRSAAGLRVAPSAFVVHFLTVVAAWGLAHAVHTSIDLVQILFVVLPVVLLSTIPVSIAGWGVRESAMVMAFGYAGLAESDGLIVSLLYGAANLGIGAIGGLVWVGSGYSWSSVKSLESETLSHERPGP